MTIKKKNNNPKNSSKNQNLPKIRIILMAISTFLGKGKEKKNT
jgi:hypothetical protein